MSATEQYLEAQAASSEEVDVPKMVNYIIQDSIECGASDIHIEPWEDMTGVRVRVNGVLSWLVGIPKDLHENICGRIKVMANLASHVKDLPQAGPAAPPEFQGVQLRVSIFPTVYGEKIVCRIFNPEAKTFDISKLGFDDETLEKFKEIVDKPTGLILLTGPTGSGKTTAIYAAIGFILDKQGNAIAVSSVEDPVEQNLDWVNQSNLNPVQGYTYPAALRSLMRQDPEIIMVGEIRDQETARIAIQASLTGHLVLTTVHTNSAVGAITRLRDMGIEPYLLSSSLKTIISQRLVRRLCNHCKQENQLSSSMAKLFNIKKGTTVFKPKGCDHCDGTGYVGRIAVAESIQIDAELKNMIHEKASEQEIAKYAFQNNLSMDEAGQDLIVSGISSAEELIRINNQKDDVSL